MDRIETPFLIDVSIPSFEHYINSLAKTGKKNYKYTDKNNKDLTYSIIEYDKDIVKFSMELWAEQLIEYYIEHSNIHWVDLGGGYRGTWKDLVINRKNYMKKMAYKWLYIPKYVKENPKKELDYVVEINQKGRKLKLNGAVK